MFLAAASKRASLPRCTWGERDVWAASGLNALHPSELDEICNTYTFIILLHIMTKCLHIALLEALLCRSSYP